MHLTKFLKRENRGCIWLFLILIFKERLKGSAFNQEAFGIEIGERKG